MLLESCTHENIDGMYGFVASSSNVQPDTWVVCIPTIYAELTRPSRWTPIFYTEIHSSNPTPSV